MTVKLFTRFDRPATTPAPFGSGVLPVFEERVSDGKTSLVKVNEELISPRLQEAMPDTLVYNILARYQRGDLTALNTNVGQFMDVVGMPTTLADAQQKLIDVRNKFNAMPLEIRQQFNNSVDEFIVSVANGDASKILGSFDAPVDVPVVDVPITEVKE